MRITIIGTGYVGLVTGAGMADLGHKIVCVDKNEYIVNKINSGISPIYEEGLTELLIQAISNNNLSASMDLENSILNSDVSIVAVGTPFDGKKIDLSQIKNAVKSIALSLKKASKYHVVCIKSTVVPGTTNDIIRPILERYSKRIVGESLGLVMNPEFLAEGSAVNDFTKPDRIIIGSIDKKSAKFFSKIYSKFKSTDKLITNLNTAEMIKYTANSYLALNISFANEMANLSSAVKNIDFLDVLKGVYLDKRISPIVDNKRILPDLTKFLYPGAGFGGSCFPKDLMAIKSFGQSKFHKMNMLNSIIKVNRQQQDEIFKIVKKAVGALNKKTICVLGLSFKPNTDDVRESPSKKIIQKLLKHGCSIKAHDPKAIEKMRIVLDKKRIKYTDKIEEALENVDAIILITPWEEYRKFFQKFKNHHIPIIDCRRVLDKNSNLNYFGVGIG